MNAKVAEETKDAEGLNGLSRGIIGCAIEVHRAMGPGLLESISLGPLINFHESVLKNGIHRVVNNFPPISAASATFAPLRS